MIQNLKAIDTHSHFNHGHKYDVRRDEIHSSDFDYLMKMYDTANIDKVFFSTYASVLHPEAVEDGNEYLYKFVREHDNIYQWVVMDPRNDGAFCQAKRILPDRKCVGVKLHPAAHKYDLDDYSDKLFSFLSDYRCAVQIHPEKMSVGYIRRIADRFPDVKFIIAHVGTLGGKTYADAIREARYGNVYVDTSGGASYSNMVIEYMVKHTGSQRILFGTDTYAAGFQRGRIEYAMIDEKDKENILRYNAERLFGELIKEK